MSKQIKETEETKVVAMDENLVEVETVEESTEKESKIKKLWAKVKKPVIVGAAAVGGFILGKILSGNSEDDTIVYDLDDSEVDVTDSDETE